MMQEPLATSVRKRPLQQAGVTDPYGVTGGAQPGMMMQSSDEVHKMRAVAAAPLGSGHPEMVAQNAIGFTAPSYGAQIASGSNVPPVLPGPASEEAEDESIYRIMAQHAEHRGPREIAGQGGSASGTENLARRYIRGRRTDDHATRTARIPVSDTYICHMCGEKGHHIRECPKRNSSERRTKKIRPATGIPRSWLRLITQDQINDFDDVYCLANSQLAVLTSSYLEHQKQASAAGVAIGGVEGTTAEPAAIGGGVLGSLGLQLSDLTCPMCNQLLRDAQLIPCCGASVCNNCIRDWIQKHGASFSGSIGRNGNHQHGAPAPSTTTVNCPLCGNMLNASEIEANTSVQESVQLYLRQQQSTSLAGGAGVAITGTNGASVGQANAPGSQFPLVSSRPSGQNVKFALDIKDQPSTGGAVPGSKTGSPTNGSRGTIAPVIGSSMRSASLVGYTPPFVFSATGGARVIEPPKARQPPPAPAPVPTFTATEPQARSEMAPLPSQQATAFPSGSNVAAGIPAQPTSTFGQQPPNPPGIGDQALGADDLLSAPPTYSVPTNVLVSPQGPTTTPAPPPPPSAAQAAGVRVLTLRKGGEETTPTGHTTPPRVLAVPQVAIGTLSTSGGNGLAPPKAAVGTGAAVSLQRTLGQQLAGAAESMEVCGAESSVSELSDEDDDDDVEDEKDD